LISILFLGDYGVELFESEVLVCLGLVEDMGVMHHFHNLFVVHGFAQFSADSFYLLEIDGAALIDVVEVEDLVKSLLALSISQFRVDNFQKIVEVDVFTLFLKVFDHLEDGLIALVESEFLKNLLNFLGVDGASALLVKQIESGLKFFKVVL
jgi:hypothetical protein